MNITCGVPQGSVLGPLLFLIYIDDLPNISDKLQFFIFADDTNTYFDSKNLKEIERTVNEELKKLTLWLNLNRLALNVSKTNFVIFRVNRPVYHNVTLLMNKKAFEQKDHVKYLGVLVDEHLRWDHHINDVARKIGRGVGIIAKLKDFLTHTTDTQALPGSYINQEACCCCFCRQMDREINRFWINNEVFAEIE